jgi:hypothetical protein
VEVAAMNPISWLREHPRAAAVGGMALALVAGVAVGRWWAPTKTEVVFQTVTEFRDVERKVIEKGPVRYKKVVVETPGKDTVTTVTVEKDPVTITVDREVEKKTTEYVRETVERDGPRVMVGLTVGAGFNAGGIQPPSYGAIVTGRVLGPLTLGVQGEGNALGGSARGIVGLSW